MHTHIDSPLQKSYDPAVMDSYVNHAKTFEEGVRQGGITMRPEPGNNPEEVGNETWYGVGGAADPHTGKRVPETVIPINPNNNQAQFNTNHALAHILSSEGRNIERRAGRTTTGRPWPGGFAGGWNETPKEGENAGQPQAVLDFSSVYGNRDDAVVAADKRGERAVFDAKNIDEIDVPSAMEEMASRKAQK